MTHASLFSGIGGPEIAAAMMGWNHAFHCEINPFGRSVLDYWFPESTSYEDITKTDFRSWRGKIDVLTGGFPCQPFSYAGKRGGREDERYLWPEMLRAIDEIRPSWVVGENVAGLATMVEGWLCTEMGGSSTLFKEGVDVHDWLVEQAYTIEEIAKGLEGLGYSVQPVLIPAAAVNAPHKRERIFILAHASNTDRCDDLREPGKDARTRREERVQERDEIRLAGVADQLRPEVQGAAENTQRDGCGERADAEPRDQRDQRDPGAGNAERVRREERAYPSDTDLQRCEECKLTDKSRQNERQHNEADYNWGDTKRMGPGERWRKFPTVSPVHRGNDGLPFSLDDLTIPPTRWRTESLKAYGNAIVPQVMFRIFQGIEQAERS